MIMHLMTPEAEATLDTAHYGVPSKGNLVQWEMNMGGPNPLPNGRYRVDEVVWHYGLVPRVVVFLTPTR